jgi:hypothetical protein
MQPASGGGGGGGGGGGEHIQPVKGNSIATRH